MGTLNLQGTMISYVLINLLCGNYKKLTPAMYILSVIFVFKFFM